MITEVTDKMSKNWELTNNYNGRGIKTYLRIHALISYVTYYWQYQ